ncbi:MFS transporter [Clostridium oryzae]|uniref:Multidrug resistance protein MdtH n=1 Tax=Clostridium oryzae TaxID=1450648 RepID=A0A1V4I783_9CLOT|nr:MFS transporter [Clostridium oryzae]OPJ55749.1 multidrug resistance protein MdtH [Clostridium oryzae]
MGKLNKLFDQYRGLPREIYVIFISRIINSMGSFVQPLLTLILTDKIGLSTTVSGLYITAVNLISVPSIIIGGRLVDTLGRKKVIIISQGLGAFTLIVCGLMDTSVYMVYVLMFSSIMYNVCTPAYDAMLADLTVPQNRKNCYSFIYMGANIGLAIGPFIGGLLYKDFLPLVFIGDGITTITSLILVSKFIKETKHLNENIKVDRKMERKVHGSVFKVLLQRPILIYFALILFCYQFEYSQYGFTLPIQLDRLFESKGAVYYGFLSSFNGIIVILFTPIISKITHKIKPLKVMALGGFCYAIAFGTLSFINMLPLFYLCIFIMTLGAIMISINSSAFIANYTPASHRGRVSSILPMIIGAGSTCGPLIMGRYISVFSIASCWVIIGTLGIISTSLMTLLSRSKLVNNKN